MKFTLKEILEKSSVETTESILDNLQDLINRINSMNFPVLRVCTSGFRSPEKQIAIYKAKGIADKSKVPMKSKHLIGRAIDVGDEDGLLKQWLLKNIYRLEREGLWCEDFAYTKGWVHFQSVPPISKNRFFIP
jgi:uncharacterized protein YcbK (DUF882 family)